MASEEDLRVAEELLEWLHEAGYVDTDWIIDQSKLADSLAEPHTAVAAADSLIVQHTATAIAAARAETWKEAIEIVQQLLPEKYQELRVVLQYGVMDEIRRDLVAALEAATGSKTKVFSREDEQKNSG